MSLLKPGTRCVIIAGCPENIGLVVEVIERLGAYDGRADAYYIRALRCICLFSCPSFSGLMDFLEI